MNANRSADESWVGKVAVEAIRGAGFSLDPEQAVALRRQIEAEYRKARTATELRMAAEKQLAGSVKDLKAAYRDLVRVTTEGTRDA